jgi:hypothetical protein
MKALFEIKEKDNESRKCDIYFDGRLLGEALHTSKIIEPYGILEMEALNFLDFDSILLPDLISFRAEGKINHLPYWDGGLFVNRLGNKITLNYYANFERHHDNQKSGHLTMLLNPLQVLLRAAAKAPEFGFEKITDAMDYMDEERALSFNYVVPASGNLAMHYQQGLKNLRALFDETMEEMRKMVGEGKG